MQDKHFVVLSLLVASCLMSAGGYYYWRDNHAYNHPMYLDRLQRTVDNWPSPLSRGMFRMVRTPHCEGALCKATIRGTHGSDLDGSVFEFDCKKDPCEEVGVLYHLGKP